MAGYYDEFFRPILLEEMKAKLSGQRSPFICTDCDRRDYAIITCQQGRDLPPVCTFCAMSYEVLESKEW